MKINTLPRGGFADRHIGPGEEETAAVLEKIGVSSLDQLIAESVPPAIRLDKPLQLPPAETEDEYLRRTRQIASRNKVFRSYIGQGYYDTIVRSEEHTSELQSLMRISYAVFCLKKKKKQ